MYPYKKYLRSRKQLVHQDTQWPEVHCPVVALEWSNQTPVFRSPDPSRPIRGQSYLVEDDLRGDILWGPTKGPGLPARVNVLREPKIDHFYVTLLIWNNYHSLGGIVLGLRYGRLFASLIIASVNLFQDKLEIKHFQNRVDKCSSIAACHSGQIECLGNIFIALCVAEIFLSDLWLFERKVMWVC